MRKKVNIKEIKPNENNPRIISDYKFKNLVKSINDFPEMLEKRPLVVDEDMVVLGGNMRLKALQQAGIKEVHVDIAKDWTDKQKKEFIIKDNLNFGEWDWDILSNEWETKELDDWGMQVPFYEDEPDYSLLDDEDLSEQLSEMQSNVKKAIQVPFDNDDYETAFELIKFFRERDYNLGKLIIELLSEKKNEVN